jgi:uncharacterized protein (TIGR00290 family)
MIINSNPGDKVFVSWSGGKDAYLSLLLADEHGLKPVCLLNFTGLDGRSRSHGIKNKTLRAQAEALGIDLVTEEVTWEGYEHGFEKAVSAIKEKYGINGAVFGDINLNEHHDWVKKMADRCSLDYNLPLWQMEEKSVSEELLNRGGKALLVAIRNDLVDEDWLGMTMDDAYIQYCLANDISPCGERGEAHTLVVDGPLFEKPLQYEKGEILRSGKYSLIDITIS